MNRIVFLVFMFYSQINCDYLYSPQMPINEVKSMHKMPVADNDYFPADAPYTEPNLTETEEENIDVKDTKKPLSEAPPSHDTYLPQDPVHEYVNSYGGPYMPPGNQFVGYPHDYMPAQWISYGPPPPPIMYAPIQTTYEGYIVPAEAHPTPEFKSALTIIKEFLPLPRSLVGVFAKASVLLFSLMGVIVFGGAITTAICSFTPLCTISFAAIPFLGLRNNPISKSEDSTTTSNIDRVRRAAELFNTAIEKFDKIQKQSTLAKRH